jgi:hypothetical protein
VNPKRADQRLPRDLGLELLGDSALDKGPAAVRAGVRQRA